MTFKQSPPGFRNVAGPLIENLQQALADQGFSPQGADGQWGGHTATALREWQAAHQLPATGIVDEAAWTAVLKQPVPPLSQRALQLTSVWEDTGYGLANGNFDGQGITWGVVGFTWANGELQGILKEILAQHPSVFHEAFGAQAAQMTGILAQPLASQMAWARSISIHGGNDIAEPWAGAFRALGDDPGVQQIENEHALHYWEAGQQLAQSFTLQSEPGLALCFDIAVQDTVTDAMIAEVRQKTATGGMAEADKMVMVAHVIADHANPRYYNDVLKRKLTFATGQGTVHEDLFDITCWGIG